MKSIRYLEAAKEEVLNEIGYLELQARGLGRRLADEIKHAEECLPGFQNRRKKSCLE